MCFIPEAIEMAGTWHDQATELVEEIGKRTNNTKAIQTIRRICFSSCAYSTSKGKRGFFLTYLFAASSSVAIRYFLFYLMSACWLGCAPGRPENNTRNACVCGTQVMV